MVRTVYTHTPVRESYLKLTTAYSIQLVAPILLNKASQKGSLTAVKQYCRFTCWGGKQGPRSLIERAWDRTIETRELSYIPGLYVITCKCILWFNRKRCTSRGKRIRMNLMFTDYFLQNKMLNIFESLMFFLLEVLYIIGRHGQSLLKKKKEKKTFL